MADIAYGCQWRIVDPFAPVDSDIVSKLTAVYSMDGRGVIHGFHLKKDDERSYQLIVTAGVIVKDYIVIRYLEDITINLTYFNLTPDQEYLVVLAYKYEKVSPPPVAGIKFILETDFNSNLHLQLGKLKIDSNSNITFLSEENKELSDIVNTEIVELVVKQELDNVITSCLCLNCLYDVNTNQVQNGYILQYNDSDNMWYAQTLLIDASNITNLTFLSLSDAPDTYNGKAGQILQVNQTETGLQFVPLTCQCLVVPEFLNDLTDVSIVGPQNQSVLSYDSTTCKWVARLVDNTNRFIDLLDTPSSYTNADGCVVCVLGNTLSFVDLSSLYASISHTHVWTDIDKTGSSINDLGDVSLSSLIDNDVLTIESGTVVNKPLKQKVEMNTFDGNSNTFTLAAIPRGDVAIFDGTQFLEQGVDFTITSQIITFATTPANGAKYTFIYID